MNTRVVVTGLGVISPVGNTAPEYWDALCAGRSGVRQVDFGTQDIPSKIAGVVDEVQVEGVGKKEVRRMGRFTLFALAAADQAWQQSGLNVAEEDPFRCGAYIGSGIGGIEDINENSVKMHSNGPRRVSPFFLPKGLVNMASGQVAIRLGLMGPNEVVVTACAAGTQSLAAAADVIRLGKADVMVAGGAESAVIPFGLAGFCAMRALSTRNDSPERASRPFDLDRDGFVMGEGAGILVLESEAHARKRGARILAELCGSGESCDAYHTVAPLSDGAGSAAAMRAALHQAQLNPEQVDYYNAHGTSTKLNDPAECAALKLVFGEKTPPVSSTKSMIGHLLGAAGAVEAVACVESLRTGVIHPNINYESPDPECDVDIVANESREGKVAIVMSNSLGFGGHNASIIFKRYE